MIIVAAIIVVVGIILALHAATSFNYPGMVFGWVLVAVGAGIFAGEVISSLALLH